MTRATILFMGLSIFLGSCIKHEVIPPPVPKVELDGSFEGTIGGAFIEYTKNVDGYYCYPSLAKQTQSGMTSAQYSFAMKSDQSSSSAQISLGSLQWSDPTGTQKPAVTSFNSFFNTNLTPDYSDLALAGFEFAYVDASGKVWRSDETETGQNITFIENSVQQESDESGDYSKFIAQFTCIIKHTYQIPDPANPPYTMDSTASMLVENARMEGYFKR